MRKRVFSALLHAVGLSLLLFGALTALLLGLTVRQILLMGVVLVVSATISALIVRKIGLVLLAHLKEPMETAEKALDRIAAGDVYAVDWSRTEGEYLSLFQAIERLQGRIHSLTSERDKVNLILDCMDEGVVLLDEHTELLASNRAARKLFHMPEDAENVEITDYIRSRRLTEAIHRLQEKKEAVVLDMEHPRRKGRSLRFFLSPVTGQKYQGQQVGMSILISDVTELKRAEGIRSEFTANVSHELKTPLTSIKGFTDMLASGMVNSAEDQKRFLTMIGVEVDRLIDLINDILKLSELESVAIAQCEETSDVLNAANEVAAFLAPVAKKADVALTVSGEHVSAAIPLDRLKELLLNLMENGIKYNEPGGSVTASLEPEQNFVRITVSDTGIGIPEESQSRVFERFYRVEKGRARKNGGTGLGLAIVKHIVVLYGGQLALQSELGKGSVFTIRLPRAS